LILYSSPLLGKFRSFYSPWKGKQHPERSVGRKDPERWDPRESHQVGLTQEGQVPQVSPMFLFFLASLTEKRVCGSRPRGKA
jgi:hypothetical protein